MQPETIHTGRDRGTQRIAAAEVKVMLGYGILATPPWPNRIGYFRTIAAPSRGLSGARPGHVLRA
jgi:hypothetical protein